MEELYLNSREVNESIRNLQKLLSQASLNNNGNNNNNTSNTTSRDRSLQPSSFKQSSTNLAVQNTMPFYHSSGSLAHAPSSANLMHHHHHQQQQQSHYHHQHHQHIQPPPFQQQQGQYQQQLIYQQQQQMMYNQFTDYSGYGDDYNSSYNAYAYEY